MTKADKRVFLVIGTVGLDEEEVANLPGEHQYTVKNLELTDPLDMKVFAKGKNADWLLREPIWRV